MTHSPLEIAFLYLRLFSEQCYPKTERTATELICCVSVSVSVSSRQKMTRPLSVARLAAFLVILALVEIATAAPESCLGEFEKCSDSGDCVLDRSLCGRCSQNQYLCPLDQKTCVDRADDYKKCPNIKGTHLDWTMTIDNRLAYLIKTTSLTEQIAQLTNKAPAIVHAGIPAYNWLNDDEHAVKNSRATVFPNGCALGATWSKKTLGEVGYAIGREARALHNGLVHEGNRGRNGLFSNGGGITMYSPNINLVRDPRWGRAQEVYSEDPNLTGQLAYSFVVGAQTTTGNWTRYLLSAACCKHFAAYDLESQPTTRLTFNAQIDSRNMWETYMVAFRQCVVEAQAAHVMCSYNAIDGVPACANSRLLNGILRDQWKWPGFVVSDYDAWALIAITDNLCPDMKCAAAVGLKAGVDQEGGSTDAICQLANALADKNVTVDQIQTAFRRLFRVRILLGMLDPPTMVEWNFLRNDSSNVASVEHIALARRAAQEAIILYKNHNQSLPFSVTQIKRMLLIGPSAIGTKVLLGNYALFPDAGVVSIRQGIEKALNDASPFPRLVFRPGCVDVECADEREFYEATEAAKTADAIVIVVGLDEGQEAEGFDRSLVELPGKQVDLVSAVRRANSHASLVVVLVHGGTIALGKILDDADAIVDVWYPGMEGGNAVADVLFGKYNPAGRAAVTSYQSTSDLPIPGTMNLYAGRGLTYRYFTGKPQFPFGYGLSYTTFSYSKLVLNTTEPNACDVIGVSVVVNNEGPMNGDEVVQVYVKQKNASGPVPNIRLADFARLFVTNGQSVTVHLSVKPAFHTYVPLTKNDVYTASSEVLVEAGPLTIYVGGGQPDYFEGHLSAVVIVQNTRHLLSC